MVLLFIFAGTYFGLAIASAFRALLAHSSQDAPVIQLIFAFAWGLMWPFRSRRFFNVKGRNHVR